MSSMQIDTIACDAFWQTYLSALPKQHPHHAFHPDAFAFSGAGELGDELAALVLSGRKRATTSLPIEFTSLGEALPKCGDLSIILQGTLAPVAIIERTDVKTISFELVDEEYAMTEGEGDGSLHYWREAHIDYFNSVCERFGGTFNLHTPVICQVFKVIFVSP